MGYCGWGRWLRLSSSGWLQFVRELCASPRDKKFIPLTLLLCSERPSIPVARLPYIVPASIMLLICLNKESLRW